MISVGPVPPRVGLEVPDQALDLPDPLRAGEVGLVEVTPEVLGLVVLEPVP